MIKLFVLIMFAQGSSVEEGRPIWAIKGQENCETVAEILSINSEPGWVYTCREAKK